MPDPYNATLLDAELKAAGLVIMGCSSMGRVDFVNLPTAADLATAAAVKAAHNPNAPQPIDALKTKISAGTATLADLLAYLKLRDGL